MSTHLLLEAAVRSLVMGAIILVALRLLRIEQVRARRTAWLLALAGALAMPVLVAAQIGPRLLPEAAFAKLTAAVAPQRVQSLDANDGTSVEALRSDDAPGAPMIDQTPPLTRRSYTEQRFAAAHPMNAVLSLAVFAYCVVAAVLTLRLCAGVGFAVRLRNRAERVIFPFDPKLDVRTTQRLATPATIGSSVLLPSTYSLWDGATLRIVLSHERAHVRQKDFYVHALAGLHCALFWFNPFSWWLQRQLSELGEALSDCAGAEQAESRTSYAETLLAFATRARWPMSGVAMASTSNLTPRIERLLNDRGFERSFAPRQRLPFIAAGIVMLAMVASTSMVRVQAASTVIETDTQTTADTRPPKNADGARVEDEEGILAIHSGHSRIMFDSGDSLPRQSGDYIYFQHDGKPYLIQDPQVIAKAQALLGPMQELGEKQKELGRQQSLLGAQQRMLGSQQRAVKLAESPEFKREMAELEKTIKDLDLPRLTAQIDQRSLAQMQAHLGEIQARVGQLQSEFGREQGKFGEKQGEIGEQQGKLGEQQALLGEQQRKIVEDAKRQLKPIIEQAIREGRATPIDNK